ncbi:MAG: hypothetical protein PHF99_08415, partial [Bacteroidales bacterium]|nr:hypothetical protein [Bacteroidales bacterium]
TRTYTVEDDCGNQSTLTQTITVDDITNPTGTAPADVTVECAGDVPTADITAITDEADNCTVNPTVTHEGDVSDGGSCPEIITRTYRITDDCGNYTDVTQTITIDDITNPTGTAPADVTVECAGDVPTADITAITDEADNCTINPTVTHEGDVSDGGSCPEIITRTYRITDDCGNYTDVTQTITIDDITNPTGTAPADVTVECAGDVPTADITAITDEADNCTINPTVTHEGDVSDGGSCPEIITRTYRITDDCGNYTDVTQTITIDDITNPTGTAPADVTVECAGDVPTADITAITDEADNCTVNPTVTHEGDVSDGGSCPEIITRTYRITDDCGNYTDVTQTITIDDTQAPLISGTILDQPANAMGSCIYEVPDVTGLVTATDNCTLIAALTITQSPVAGTEISANTAVTITVADECGNTATTFVNILVPASVTASTTNLVNQNCLTPGSATVEGANGTSPYTYTWPSTAGGVSGNTASSLMA